PGPGDGSPDGLEVLGSETGHGCQAWLLHRPGEQREVALGLDVRGGVIEEERFPGRLPGEERLEEGLRRLREAVDEEVAVDEVEGLALGGEQLSAARLVGVDAVGLGPELGEAPDEVVHLRQLAVVAATEHRDALGGPASLLQRRRHQGLVERLDVAAVLGLELPDRGRVETMKSTRAMASRRVSGAERSISRRSSGERAPRISSREDPSAIAWAIRKPAAARVCASAWRSAMTLAGRTTGVAPGVMGLRVPSGAV